MWTRWDCRIWHASLLIPPSARTRELSGSMWATAPRFAALIPPRRGRLVNGVHERVAQEEEARLRSALARLASPIHFVHSPPAGQAGELLLPFGLPEKRGLVGAVDYKEAGVSFFPPSARPSPAAR